MSGVLGVEVIVLNIPNTFPPATITPFSDSSFLSDLLILRKSEEAGVLLLLRGS